MIKASTSRRRPKTSPGTPLLAGLTTLLLLGAMQVAVAADFAAPIGDDELGAQRGREGTIIDLTAASSHLDGNLSNNTVTGTTNGSNIIRDGAFSGLNGHATVIQNSGNNNLIQDSTIYNFSLSP